MTSSGATAKKRGAVLESIVTGTLTSHGLEVVSHREWSRRPAKYGHELLLRNVPYENIYSGMGRTEFVVLSRNRGLNVRIEAKWQQGAGSVDEKFPYTYLNAIEFPEDEVIILVGGQGFRAGAIEWLKNAAASRLWVPASKPAKNIHIMNPTEFITWANHVFA